MTGPTRMLIIFHFYLRDCHPLWFRFPSDSTGFCNQRTGPVSLAATKGVAIAFLSSGYLDVSVRRVDREPWDQRSFDSYPKLIAAFHALASNAKTSPVCSYLLDHPHSGLIRPMSKGTQMSTFNTRGSL